MVKLPFIQTIKVLLNTDQQKRNMKDIIALSNEIKNIAFLKKYQDEGYDDGKLSWIASLDLSIKMIVMHVSAHKMR